MDKNMSFRSWSHTHLFTFSCFQTFWNLQESVSIIRAKALSSIVPGQVARPEHLGIHCYAKS